MSERDNISPRVKASIANARRRSFVLRIAVALAVVMLTGALLVSGYGAATSALPSWSDGGMASLLWLPLAIAAGLVVLTAAVLLSAIARWR